MLGEGSRGFVEATHSPNFGTFKRHKSLPHRRIPEDGVASTQSKWQGKQRRHKSDQIAYTSAERIESWIPEPSPIQVMPVVGVPLTPPINFRDDSQSWIDDSALRSQGFAKTLDMESAGTTPLVQQSPPTPDSTPPRKTHGNKSAIQPVKSRIPSDSRTESFKTAQENLSPDEGSRSAESPLLNPTRQKWVRATSLSNHTNVSLGLGLGLESEDEEPAHKTISPKHQPRKHEFVTFDGTWGGDEAKIQDDTSHRASDSAWPLPQKQPRKHSQSQTRPPSDSPTLGKELDSSLMKSLNLRQRVERSRRSLPHGSTEKFGEQINWPLKDEHSEPDTEVRDAPHKRLSQVSTASTVVEAMVIDSPPRRRQTLRHTGKITTLDPGDHSNRSSVNSSNDPSLRRRLRRGKSPDQELRRSFASETPEGDLPDPAKTRLDSVSIVVIPDRRSSLQSSVSSSKHVSRTFSMNSRQQSSRPTTAPEEAVGYFDIPRRERRAMSIVVHSPTPIKHDAKIEKTITTLEPPQSSPPSISVSNEPSRAASMTSGGMNSHHAQQSPNGQQLATLHITDPQEAPGMGADRSIAGPRSALVTPFSLRSAHSSTPGTLEVNEATAISIYPHTNKSILVIQQTTGRTDSSVPQEQSAIIAGNANIELPGPITPVIHHESPPRELLHSPLKNPRDPPHPPLPPDFQIIPPTPANAQSSSDDTQQSHSIPAKPDRISARFSSMKRSFSARRYSESFVLPLTRNLSLRSTKKVARHRRPSPSDDPDSKLHPFWRPRSFWDGMDESDSDSEFGNTGPLSLSRRPSQNSRETTPRRPASLTRKLTGSIRLPTSGRSKRRWSIASAPGINDYEFVHPHVPRNEENKAENMPRQGYQVQFVGFRGLADKLERRREAREEGRREERRKKLRGKIGVVGNGDGAGIGAVGWAGL